MSPWWWIILPLAWLIWAALSSRLEHGPRGDGESALALGLVRIYARFVHRLRVEGREHLPDFTPGASSDGPGPLIIVANHTAGIDPLLIQAAVPFEIRWMMAADMMTPIGNRLWNWAGVIPVDRDGGDSKAAREALRELKAGGVIGVFPESGIERPARQIMPFAPGIALLALKGGRERGRPARVQPVVIQGTPDARTAFGSLLRTSRATVTFLPPVEYAPRQWTAESLVADLRSRFLAHTGWPANDRPEKKLVRA